LVLTRRAVSKSHLLSFDSDSDTDPDTDYDPHRDRDVPNAIGASLSCVENMSKHQSTMFHSGKSGRAVAPAPPDRKVLLRDGGNLQRHPPILGPALGCVVGGNGFVFPASGHQQARRQHLLSGKIVGHAERTPFR
jgi:hypothetical protein